MKRLVILSVLILLSSFPAFADDVELVRIKYNGQEVALYRGLIDLELDGVRAGKVMALTQPGVPGGSFGFVDAPAVFRALGMTATYDKQKPLFKVNNVAHQAVIVQMGSTTFVSLTDVMTIAKANYIGYEVIKGATVLRINRR